MSFYVKRSRAGRQGWTGPIQTHSQAGREVDAWRQAGWEAHALVSTPEIKAQVKAWEKSVKQDGR